MSRYTALVKSCYLTSALLLALVPGGASAEAATAGEQPAKPPAADSQAAQPQTFASAHEVVQQVTDQMLELIERNRATLEENSDQFYSEVQAVLDPVVDFRFIARVVMGSFGSRATPEQRQRFADTFKNDLVTTYARGMAGFGNQDIVVVPPAKDISNHCRVGVEQEVRGADGVNRVSYTMMRRKLRQGEAACGGEWKLINVVINGVNLGNTFRSQFAQAMLQQRKKNGNEQKTAENLDVVISNWSASATN